jgi:hypothetical protein
MNVMKKIIYLIIVVAAFSACKNKSNLESNKELITLGDSSYSGSYLTDTGAVANPDEFINAGGVVSGKATVPDAPVASTTKRRTSTSSGSTTRRSGSSGSSTSGTTRTTNQKKGMSKAAQGAVIGGVGGAVAGAVIGKSGKGAVIGGVVGAAGGYIIGRSKDKKSGRVQ